jgi:iron(III) transport system substrate-binding protein
LASLASLALLVVACGQAAPGTGSPAAGNGPLASVSGNAESMLAALEKLSDKDRQDRLMAGARNEKVVVWYDTLETSVSQPIIKAFNAQFPYIEVRYNRESGGPLTQQFMAEERAGRHLADVFNGGANQQTEPQQAGFLAEYDSSAKRQIPDGYKTKTWTARALSATLWAYNKDIATDLPKPQHWKDLLDPVFSGKFLMDDEAAPDINVLNLEWGQAEVEAYLAKLVAQKPLVYHGRTQVAQQLAAGAKPLALNAGLLSVLNLKNKGAPLQEIFPAPFSVATSPLSLSKNAPHPYAAALMYDFVIGSIAQKIVADGGDVSPNPSVVSKYAQHETVLKSPNARVMSPEKVAPLQKTTQQLVDKYLAPKR